MYKKHLFHYIAFLLISFLAELFLFNYKYWHTLGNHEVIPEQITMGDAYVLNKDGTYSTVDGDFSIRISGLDLDLKSAYFNILILSEEESPLPTVTDIYQWVTDTGHRYEYSLPVKKLWSNQPKSSYYTYHLYGNLYSIRFIPNISDGLVVDLNIILNPVIPLSFSLLRMTGLFLALCFFYIFRPSSQIYNAGYLNIPASLRTAMLLFLFLIHMTVFWKMAGLNPAFTWDMPEHQKQYQKLAESFRESSVSLLTEPGDALKSLDNPYDLDNREYTLEGRGETYLWDTVYFNGKYYVYFGVIPVLLYYYPYHLITGGAFPNNMAVFISLALLYLGIIGSLHEMVKKWFPNLSLGVWFLTTELFLLGSNTIYMAKRPDLYTVPIVTGLALGMLGLWCFLRADKKDNISLRYLSAGSLLTALTAGCRPQLILFMVFPAILFGRYLFNKDFYRKKEGRQAVIAATVPILAVAAFLMYYNYVRFESVFDFGSSYNLTTNDMRYRGWVWGRIPLGIFVYLFQPIRLITDFPFAEAIYTGTQYMGMSIQELTIGGIFATHLFAWLAIPAIFMRKGCEDTYKLPCILSISSLVCSLIIIVADTEMSGILWRYFNDFSLPLMLSALLSAWILFCNKKEMNPSVKKWLICLLVVCFATEILFQGVTFFVDTSHALMNCRPDLYSRARYLIAFWL